ncbi:MAG: ATP--guanido phosphotransferase [Planctomycetota bacterium]
MADDTIQLDEWLSGRGPESDVVYCTRVRLARNVEGFTFSPRQDAAEADTLVQTVHKALAPIARDHGLRWLDLREVPGLERQVLVERHLISRELEASDRPRAVLVAEDGRECLMVNEEDHLRLQVFRSGLDAQSACAAAEGFDDEVAEVLPYAFSSRLGFLTSCPTNTGTGLRISVMVHLPALVLTKEIDKATMAIQEMNMTVRGFFGEGSHAVGDLFQVSNQRTLGESEEQILQALDRAVSALVRWERKQREEFRDRPLYVEDQANRALGVLTHARILSSEETINLISKLRLGRLLDFVPEPSLEDLNRIFLLTQPGHLQRKVGRELLPGERDRLRSEWVRRILRGEAGGDAD